MRNEVLLGSGVGAGPDIWLKNPTEFVHLDLSSSYYYYKWLFTHHYGQHKHAILPVSYLQQIKSMTVKQWLCDVGDALVIFPPKYNGINKEIVNFFKDEHCIVWLGYDRKVIRKITKIAKELCSEYYPNDDTAKFLRLIKSNYIKVYGSKPWTDKESD